MYFVLRTVNRYTSKSGLGFAGATGLLASGLTDIASTLGPLLPWFSFIAGIATLLLALLIRSHAQHVSELSQDPPFIRTYCQSFIVLLGSFFGSAILLISGALAGNTTGSNILAILNEIQSGVERVEERVDEISEEVAGLGESVSILDITGRSGTGKIGDNAVFKVSLTNERLMRGASCRLVLRAEWQDRLSVLDQSCETFTVKLPYSPLLDANGKSMGDIVPVPFELEVLDTNDNVIATYASTYPFHNNYRTVDVVLDPPGNRFAINEQRAITIDVGDAELPDQVECEWTVFDPVTITTTSDNGCTGVLSTEVDSDSYIYNRLVDEGEIRDQIYVQINAVADFGMLGNSTLSFAVRP